MPPKPRMSLETRGKIVVLSEEGYSSRQIAARLGWSRKSVSLILQKQRLTGSVADRQTPGRSRKTSSKEDRLIVRKSKSDRFKTAPQILAEVKVHYGINVSISTAQRRLRETGPWDSRNKANVEKNRGA